MADNFSRTLGDNLVAVLGRFPFLWTIQQMGSTDAVLLLGDVIAHHNNTGDNIHEVRHARYSDCKE